MTKDQLLLGYTGVDSVGWVSLIESLIRTYFDADPDNPHPECDAQWLHSLVDEIDHRHAAWMSKPRRFERFRKPRPAYDGNISRALLLSVILGTWSVRLSRAKAHDSPRPLELRKVALHRNRMLVSALHDAIYDETHDAEFFDLPWQYPYMDGATSGDFV